MNMNQSFQTPGKKWAGDILPRGVRTAQMAQMTPEQMQLMEQGLKDVGPDSYLYKLAHGDQSQFAELEAPAFNQFNEQMGGLASRFSGMGMGGRRSSGFQNMGGQAAANFAQQLQSNRMNLRNQAIQNLHNMSQQLLGLRPYEREAYEKQQSSGFNWGGAASGALSGGIQGFMAGGPWGAAAGATLGGVTGGFGGNSGGMDYSSLSGLKGFGESPGTTTFSRSSGFGTPPWA